MSSMKEKPDWPRVRITVVPYQPGLTPEQLNEVVLALCQRFWDAGKIPVVGWGGEFDGCELHPPYLH